MRLERIGMLAAGLLVGSLVFQSPAAAEDTLTLSKPGAGKKAASAKASHPLLRVIDFAMKGLQRTDQQIEEYACLLIKRERVGGNLTARQYMQAKIRHRRLVDGEVVTPFSVYLKFLKPADVAGREVLYVENQRDGDVLARRGGPRLANLTVELNPKGAWAMQDNLHPITEIGFRNLIYRLIENMRGDVASDDVEVKFYDNARLGDRECEHIQVTHAQRSDVFDYHIARIFIDKEMQVPVYFASYDWSALPDGEPPLQEEYIFANVDLNPGFTDLDFDSTNPDYAFEPLASSEALAQAKK